MRLPFCVIDKKKIDFRHTTGAYAMPGCDTSILVSQPAKDINSIAPYTYVTHTREIELCDHSVLCDYGFRFGFWLDVVMTLTPPR
eukprot:COSAG01_NODE_2275_length_8019_cov_79.308838_7_plen_85_part_00